MILKSYYQTLFQLQLFSKTNMIQVFNPENAPVTGTSPQVQAITQAIKEKK
jgi:hypothetical protein